MRYSSASYGKGHWRKTELNLTHFYTNPNYFLALWEDLDNLNLKQLEILGKYVLVKLCGKEKIGP